MAAWGTSQEHACSPLQSVSAVLPGSWVVLPIGHAKHLAPVAFPGP
jgi:hypothetical protein